MAHFLPFPKEIQDKIYMMSNSPTPTAKIIVESYEFAYRFLKNENLPHGSPFDRGCADAYYYREPTPHKWLNGDKRQRLDILTEVEELQYMVGYEAYPNRKE